MKIMLNKDYNIKTAIGGCLTLITIMLVLIFTWFIGKDIIYKEKPISYIQTDVAEKHLNINISKKTFPFSFTMTDDDNVPLVDFSYLAIKLFIYEYELDEEKRLFMVKNLTEHETKFCDYYDFPNIKKKLFDDAQLSLTLCPKEDDVSFNLYGSCNENKIKFIQISIEMCKNSTYNDVICKSNEEIKKFLGNLTINLNLYYRDTKVLINNNTHPVEYLTASRYKYIISEYYKEIVYKIQTQNIYTDNGLVFSTEEENNFYKLVEDFADFRQISDNYFQLLVFEIYSSNISQSYYRRYIKIPDVIAFMGGILKIFYVSFLYLNSVFSEVEKNIAIVNEVFILNKCKEKPLTSQLSKGLSIKNLYEDIKASNKYRNHHVWENNQTDKYKSTDKNEINFEYIKEGLDKVESIDNKNNILADDSNDILTNNLQQKLQQI